MSLLLGLLLVTLESPETVDLGGLRKAQAVVNLDGDQFEIKVQFLPVKCFDKTTNQEMNLGVGRGLALQALARHMAGKRSVNLVVSGARTVESSLSGKTFMLTLRVPREGVKIVDAADTGGTSAAVPEGERAEASHADTSKLTRRGEYEQTIAELGIVLGKELKQIQAEAGPDKPSSERIDSFRKKLQTSFDQLAQVIKDDIELTSIGSDLDSTSKSEKDQLLDALSAARDRLARKLDGATSP
jgi:hypothetical protein